MQDQVYQDVLHNFPFRGRDVASIKAYVDSILSESSPVSIDAALHIVSCHLGLMCADAGDIDVSAELPAAVSSGAVGMSNGHMLHRLRELSKLVVAVFERDNVSPSVKTKFLCSSVLPTIVRAGRLSDLLMKLLVLPLGKSQEDFALISSSLIESVNRSILQEDIGAVVSGVSCLAMLFYLKQSAVDEKSGHENSRVLEDTASLYGALQWLNMHIVALYRDSTKRLKTATSCSPMVSALVECVLLLLILALTAEQHSMFCAFSDWILVHLTANRQVVSRQLLQVLLSMLSRAKLNAGLAKSKNDAEANGSIVSSRPGSALQHLYEHQHVSAHQLQAIYLRWKCLVPYSRQPSSQCVTQGSTTGTASGISSQPVAGPVYLPLFLSQSPLFSRNIVFPAVLLNSSPASCSPAVHLQSSPVDSALGSMHSSDMDLVDIEEPAVRMSLGSGSFDCSSPAGRDSFAGRDLFSGRDSLLGRDSVTTPDMLLDVEASMEFNMRVDDDLRADESLASPQSSERHGANDELLRIVTMMRSTSRDKYPCNEIAM